jgi:activator of Hsp90 ATPase-like protein
MIETSTPVVVDITVEAPVQDAWRTFTEDLGSWWPVLRHSIGEKRVTEVLMEGKTGGRVFERWDNGEEYVWADILEWDEPTKLALSWHPNPEATTATELEVRFEPVAEGTRVTLEHRGWESLGELAAEARESYETEWPSVLDLFARRAGDA